MVRHLSDEFGTPAGLYRFFLLQKIEHNSAGQYQAKSSDLKRNHNLPKEKSYQLFGTEPANMSGSIASKDPAYQLSEHHLTELPLHVKLCEDTQSGLQNPRIVFIKQLLKGKTRPIPIFVKKPGILSSHVASGFLRRFWEFFARDKLKVLAIIGAEIFPAMQ